ncbi:hypothetical protein QF011_002542 [Curtobacterium flaccumfaciens]|nr:family 16 glycosylhydrolase [Curtobacterium flaccumfaciens]MDQ0539976.1 hypothetical protein [Curtobacterium flaccumfaciens]
MIRYRAILAAATAGALVLGVPTAASARTWWGWDGERHRHHAPVDPTPTPAPAPAPAPDETGAPAPTDEWTPEAEPTQDSAPVEDTAPVVEPEPASAPAPDAEPGVDAAPDADASPADLSALAPDAPFVEDFTTNAVTGLVQSLYPQSWHPYPDGTSGIYAPSKTVSVHDGVMDVALGTGTGAAGTFGSSDGAWDHVGGSFSVRAKATGGDGNGAAFMLWPTSNVWSDGEIDFPEGNFEDSPSAFHHSMTPGKESDRVQVGTGVSWREWHTYKVDWVPGESVTYSVDGTVLDTVTDDVPTTPHRFMFQVGNWGEQGNLLIDWVSTTE